MSNKIKKLLAGQESAQTDAQTDEQTDGQTDRQTDSKVIPIYPLNFVHGGYSELEFDSLKS